MRKMSNGIVLSGLNRKRWKRIRITSLCVALLLSIIFYKPSVQNSRQNTHVLPTTTLVPTISQNTPTTNKTIAIVARVIDGDTIELTTGQKVRYIGIDTPETVHPNKPAQCFGKEASDKNKELVEGKTVEIEKDVTDKDMYGRLLRYVWLGSTLINERLVQEGYAVSYTYPPDIKYQHLFVAAQKKARSENRGLWSDVCISPPPSDN